MNTDLKAFLIESNWIEGIETEPTNAHIDWVEALLRLAVITVTDMERLAKVFQPDAKLRDKPGMDVRVGNHIPPKGGRDIPLRLESILQALSNQSPWRIHGRYETLHPFTDCNGRTGRLLWLWQMEREYGGAPLGFLRTYYVQTLSER